MATCDGCKRGAIYRETIGLVFRGPTFIEARLELCEICYQVVYQAYIKGEKTFINTVVLTLEPDVDSAPEPPAPEEGWKEEPDGQLEVWSEEELERRRYEVAGRLFELETRLEQMKTDKIFGRWGPARARLFAQKALAFNSAVQELDKRMRRRR